MKRMRILGLALVAVFAFAAIGASAASAALPAYFACTKVEGGKFVKKCGHEAVGTEKAGYEPVQGRGKNKVAKGKSKPGTKATLYTPALKSEISCASFKSVQNITASGEGVEKLVATFGKCTTLGKNCTSAGAKKGSIVTPALSGQLGYVNKAAKTVGVALKPETGEFDAVFECEGLLAEVRGSVIGELKKGINEFGKEQESVFAVNAGTHQQVIKKFDGDPEEHVLEAQLNKGAFFESGQEADALVKGEELSLKA
jgi:hypothetical protein